MCGFIGELINTGMMKTDCYTWNNAIETIHHRGPDSTGYYTDDYVQLGFKRLSIIDLEKGSQPFSIEERYHMVFNGEIYNYIELRDQLIADGHQFITDSDTEVLLKLFIAKGADCVKELRGMFAYAIWDKISETLFAARDSFGIKPFYYTESEEKLFFASEQKSIHATRVPDKIRPDALENYLSFQYVPEPDCLSGNIQKLAPGHCLIKKPDEPVQIKAYQKNAFKPVSGKNHSLPSQIRSVLEDSVEKHMRSDVPVGAFLSSGIDSTVIAALAKKHNPGLKTFTVGFENKGFSEIDIAKDTAEKLGVENIHKLITPAEFTRALPEIIWHMDDPVADPAAVPLYFVAAEAAKHVKVVLSGEGADELFGGYNIYREPVALNWFKYLPASLKVAIRKNAVLLPPGMKGQSYLLRGATPLAKRYIGNANIFTTEEKKKLLSNYSSFPFTNVTAKLYEEAQFLDDTLKMQYIDLHTWLPGDILVKADRMTMAHSIELRVPFLDKEVFSLASTLPTETKIAKGTTKYILREAVKELIPDTVINRKKLGFPVPIRHWLKDELYDWARTIIVNSPTEHLFNKKEALGLLVDHAEGKADNSRKLWVILCFMLWHAKYIENALYNTADNESLMVTAP